VPGMHEAFMILVLSFCGLCVAVQNHLLTLCTSLCQLVQSFLLRLSHRCYQFLVDQRYRRADPHRQYTTIGIYDEYQNVIGTIYMEVLLFIVIGVGLVYPVIWVSEVVVMPFTEEIIWLVGEVDRLCDVMHVPTEVVGFLKVSYWILDVVGIYWFIRRYISIMYNLTGKCGHRHSVYSYVASGDLVHNRDNWSGLQPVRIEESYTGETFENLRKHRLNPYDHTYAFRKLGFNSYVEVEINKDMLSMILEARPAVSLNETTPRLLFDEAVRLNKALEPIDRIGDLRVLHNTAVAAYQQLCLARIDERLATGNVGKPYFYMTPTQL